MQIAEKNQISVSEHFSHTPGARYYSDGEDSGEKFYDTILRDAFKRALEDNEKLVVNLDGTEGYATSFLDEAFMRLSKEFTKEKVLAHLEIISNEEPDWIIEIESYINEAY